MSSYLQYSENALVARISQFDSEPDHVNTLEDLKKLMRENSPALVEVDLSEQETIPSDLARALLALANEALNLGCDVRFAGIQSSVFGFEQHDSGGVSHFGLTVSMNDRGYDVTLQCL